MRCLTNVKLAGSLLLKTKHYKYLIINRMKKSSTKTKTKEVKENQKISNYFKKLPPKPDDTPPTIEINSDEDDIIPVTPDVNLVKSKKILSPITNKLDDNVRKRKLPSTTLSPKKNTKRKNENAIASSSRLHKTPEKMVNFLGKRVTPTGKVSSKKSSPSNSRTPRKKLFECSSDTSGFKVEIIDNFVKITPSKSSVKSEPFLSPKNSGKKQESMLNYVSPSRAFEVQILNETTPVKTATKESLPSTSKVKIKLNFDQYKIKEEPKVEVVDTFDDLFDDIVWDNFNLSQELYLLDLSKPQHCKITAINTSGKNLIEIIVKSTKTDAKAKCILEGFWVSTKIEVDATIYLTAVKENEMWKVSNIKGLLVYEPDLLVSSTSVVGAIFCKRRSIFKDRFYGFEPENKCMIVGILVHTLLQNALKSRADTTAKVESILKTSLNSKDLIRMLYKSSLKLSEIKKEVSVFIPRVVEFLKSYVNRNGGYLKWGNWNGHIDDIKDIEENIWCPELGMKGKVDVSLSVGNKTVPLELKTGRATISLEHRGQVMIYIMMMLKLGYKVSSGLLLYLREGVLKEIPLNENEKRDLILLRNELAYYLKQKPSVSKDTDIEDVPLQMQEFPEPINHHSACEKCPYNIICCAYLRQENFGFSNYKHLNQVNNQILSHINDRHIKYFVHWSNLLDLESSCKMGKDVSMIYTLEPEEREKHGRSLTFLNLTNCINNGDGLYNHTFKRKSATNNTTFLISGLGESSYVVVSTDTRPAVSAGLVTFMDHCSITVTLDRHLLEKYPTTTVFHLDSYDSNNIDSFNLSNLALLLEPTEQSNKLRSLIIDKSKPKFLKTLPRIIAQKAPSILKRLNKVQQRAVLKALTAEDYVLVKGMPGTGKTATIVALVELLMEIGQSVLITSYTHNAVDNVCLRLQKRGIKVLRLGAQGRVHSELKEVSEYELTKDCESVEELERVYNEAKILAVTCLGSKHPVLSKRMIDVCLVDESTQALQCSLFRALSVCKKFVLIGDPDQLPPVVKNQQAVARGMSESLFERLQNDEATVTLNINYRMNKTITNLANKFMYKGELEVGNESVANATLKLKESVYGADRLEWISKILEMKLKDSIKIVDTGPTYSMNVKPSFIKNFSSNSTQDISSEQAKCTNFYETAIVYKLINTLLNRGVEKEDIGVIAPYRAQVAQLSTVLLKTGVDVSTVDQFQGQDKNVIIYSCTKSTEEPKISRFDILEDRRRLNVAITRAKHKLIIIGDVQTIGKYSTFSKLLENVDNVHFIRLENEFMGFDWEEVLNIKVI